jgi:hypothetical protein
LGKQTGASVQSGHDCGTRIERLVEQHGDTVEPYDGTLRSYVDDANIQSLKKSAVKAKVKSADFTTDAKIPAYKVKLQNRANNVDIAQTMYFFEGPGNKKIVVTCTAPAQFESGLEPLFDACMKTFALSSR